MSKGKFHIEKVLDDLSLEESFRPALQRLKAKGLPDEEVRDFLKKSLEFNLLEKEYLSYSVARRGIEMKIAQGDTWRSIFASIMNQYKQWTMEAFLDTVEAMQQVQVTDASQLAQITRIEDKEALASAMIIGRESKYFRTLRLAIEEGALFSDLQQIEPAVFGLPESWLGLSGSEENKQSSIVRALGAAYSLSFHSYEKVSPHLRSIAHDLNAPYSTVVEAFKGFHKQSKTSHPNLSANEQEGHS